MARGRSEALAARQKYILTRLDQIESRIFEGLSHQAQAPSSGVSAVQQKLEDELKGKGFDNYRFQRVPKDYYEQELPFRMSCLNAHSVHHLCKSVVVENSRAHPSVVDCSDPNNSKYYLILVQYSARFHAEKVKRHIYKLNAGKFAGKYFNIRLAPEDVSGELTGYQHNAVTPIGLRTSIPIIMSHKIAELQPDFFWLGAGEVDLKVGFTAKSFIHAYSPMVLDCTYE